MRHDFAQMGYRQTPARLKSDLARKEFTEEIKTTIIIIIIAIVFEMIWQ